jgi:hypothetical protein
MIRRPSVIGGTTRRGLLAAALVVLGVAGSAPAEAFVRYSTSAGNPFSWRTETVKIVVYPHGLPSMSVDQITAALTASVSPWSKEDPANAACSYLDLVLSLQAVSALPPAAVHDDKNIIAIRDGDWEAICSTSKDGTKVCHQSAELALTTVWSRACGEIVEADIEVNASKDFTWGDLETTPTSGAQDLQNAVTHEMGHFIGLDHSCLMAPLLVKDPKTGELVPFEPVDNLGVRVPLCSAATPEQKEATMFPQAQPGDLSKRSLSADDRLGVCSIYPVGATPMHCGLGESAGGCALADDHDAGRHGWLWGALALVAGAFVYRRRFGRR